MKKSVLVILLALLLSIFLIGSLFITGCSKLPTAAVKSTPYQFSQEIVNNVEKDTAPWRFQVAAADYAVIGQYQKSLAAWEQGIGAANKTYNQHQKDSLTKIYNVENAKTYIIQAAQTHRLVMVNEAHHVPRHRTFMTTLLKELYQLGFRNLGLEALDKKDSKLNQRGFPIQQSGYYTVEPQFGNLIRTAIDIGYHVFPYEASEGKNGKDREIEQAQNIKKEMDLRPNEKFLIFCGYDHNLEGKHDFWGQAMASKLAELTQLDPLTINQTAYTPKSQPKYNHPLLKTFPVQEPAVLVDENQKAMRYIRNEAWSDIVVLHPNVKQVNGREDWLTIQGRKATPFKLSNSNLNYPAMLFAYKKGERKKGGIPMDIVELEDKRTPFFVLPKGNYEVVIKDGKNTTETLLKID